MDNDDHGLLRRWLHGLSSEATPFASSGLTRPQAFWTGRPPSGGLSISIPTARAAARLDCLFRIATCSLVHTVRLTGRPSLFDSDEKHRPKQAFNGGVNGQRHSFETRPDDVIGASGVVCSRLRRDFNSELEGDEPLLPKSYRAVARRE